MLCLLKILVSVVQIRPMLRVARVVVLADRTAAFRGGCERQLKAVIDGRTYWISEILCVKESLLRAQTDKRCTRKDRSGRRVSRESVSLSILLFVHEGLKLTDRLASGVHQLS